MFSHFDYMVTASATYFHNPLGPYYKAVWYTEALAIIIFIYVTALLECVTVRDGLHTMTIREISLGKRYCLMHM